MQHELAINASNRQQQQHAPAKSHAPSLASCSPLFCLALEGCYWCRKPSSPYSRICEQSSQKSKSSVNFAHSVTHSAVPTVVAAKTVLPNSAVTHTSLADNTQLRISVLSSVNATLYCYTVLTKNMSYTLLQQNDR